MKPTLNCVIVFFLVCHGGTYARPGPAKLAGLLLPIDIYPTDVVPEDVPLVKPDHVDDNPFAINDQPDSMLGDDMSPLIPVTTRPPVPHPTDVLRLIDAVTKPSTADVDDENDATDAKTTDVVDDLEILGGHTTDDDDVEVTEESEKGVVFVNFVVLEFRAPPRDEFYGGFFDNETRDHPLSSRHQMSYEDDSR